MNILITTGKFKNCIGGVSSFYRSLYPHWSFKVRYCVYGKRNINMSRFITFFIYQYDLLKYITLLIFTPIDVVIINPSLRKMQLLRDGIILIIAKLFNKSVVTHFHGWDDKYFDEPHALFKKIYNQNSYVYVLSSSFKDQLLHAGINCPVLLSTTQVDDNLIANFDINSKMYRPATTILFVARIVKSKGIFEALNTFAILKNKYPKLRFIVCGDGPDLAAAKKHVHRNNISGVEFMGAVLNIDIIQYYQDADIFILPTHGEGMSISVLEAMAFGLPIISRPIGGIVDYFKENDMGFLIDSLDPINYADKIEIYINNITLKNKTALYNNKYAKEHFLASVLVQRIETDLLHYVK